MASGGKKKTTMAKLDRERKMREKRIDKAARRNARKEATAAGIATYETADTGGSAAAEPDDPSLTRS